jgi:uncharacterized protein
MAPADLFDVAALHLAPGEGRRFALEVAQEPLELAGERYKVEPPVVPVTLEVSRMNGGGVALRLRLTATLAGGCMRCLEPAAPLVEVDTREIDVPGGDVEMQSPYVEGDAVDLRRWVHDAVALAAPAQVLCDPDCPGLCPQCAIPLATAGPDHHHERAPDPRWQKLRELDLGGDERNPGGPA